MQTKIKKEQVENLRNGLGSVSCFAMDSNGLSEGIGLFWLHEIVVDLKNFSSGHIDTMVRRQSEQSIEWRFTGFSRAPRAEKTS